MRGPETIVVNVSVSNNPLNSCAFTEILTITLKMYPIIAKKSNGTTVGRFRPNGQSPVIFLCFYLSVFSLMYSVYVLNTNK